MGDVPYAVLVSASRAWNQSLYSSIMSSAICAMSLRMRSRILGTSARQRAMRRTANGSASSIVQRCLRGWTVPNANAACKGAVVVHMYPAFGYS